MTASATSLRGNTAIPKPRRTLSDAHVTMVTDRESHIYPLFAPKPEQLDLIVRAVQDRELADDRLLFETPPEAELVRTTSLRVASPGPGENEPIAEVEYKIAQE